MTIIRGYKAELKLNNKQRTLCLKSAGVARFTYNWGLRIKIDEYETTGKSPFLRRVALMLASDILPR